MVATHSLLQVLLGLSFLVPRLLAQDHIQCIDSGSDWYTSVVGETPCRTYERLRQICNSNYVLGALSPNTPPDTCNDQLADCCCNSIAFGLSMLCLTCQRGIGPNGNGIDAGIGAYQQYLKHGSNSFCTPNTNKSFTNDIQSAVCNNGLKIHNSFYDAIFWANGPWFYTWSREQMEKVNAADGNNSFTHCASTTVVITSSSQSQPMSLSESTPLSQSTMPSQLTLFSQSTFLSQSTMLSQAALLSQSTFLSQSTSHSQSTSISRSTLLSQSMSPPLSSTSSTTDSTTASVTSASTFTQRESPSKSLNAGAIAGIVVGCIAGAGAITLFLFWWLSFRRRQAAIEDSETSARPFLVGHAPSMYNSPSATEPLLQIGSPLLTSGSAERRFEEKRQRELPPAYSG
ncbi:uncharacterized protein EV420DRAFT_630229 [Desarmillaria tabescens]|uniref:Mid2 domain-containing protein n=1 Tax=Armillaria tabescens TaxID=1929756 RepID=A0AA39MI81_ARMTA|nr:uncharacterized protein EV420DRAFT_295509 [Desarmillaria tabescens]XP_060328240.1 uncharacterized protein EV420DRAFT_630229 [Desarmillaria tabescens]KAK0435811.1 hypothetical protein EV420DRAFT_295509 [Desarmillaria tabescens]KAK0452904.1 hypothetical protein EV420DRAFT_630229 [Desarmillaria tabescens]